MLACDLSKTHHLEKDECDVHIGCNIDKRQSNGIQLRTVGHF